MKTQKGVDLSDDLADALQEKPEVLAVFELMRPSCQRGYVDWIGAAGTDSLRDQRVVRVLAKITRWGERHALIG